MPTAGDLVINFLGRHEQFSKTAATVRNEMKKTADAAKPMAGSLATAFSPLLKLGGAAAGIAGISLSAQAAVGAVAALIGEMRDMAQAADRLSVSVEFYQKMSMAAKSVGVDANTMAAGLSKMQRMIAEAVGGNETAAKAFRDMGLSAKFLQSVGVEQAFTLMADAMQKVADPMERTRLEMVMFEEGGPKLRIALEQAAQGFVQFKDSIVSDAEVRNIAQVAAQWDLLMMKAKAYGATAVSLGILGAKQVDWTATAVGAAGAMAGMPGLGTATHALRGRAEQVSAPASAATASAVSDEMRLQSELARDAEKLAASALQALKDHQKEQEELNKLEEDYARKQKSAYDAMQKRGEAIRESVRTPLEELRDTMNELEALRSFGFIDEETFARAGLEAQAKRLAAEKGAAVDEAGAPKMQFAGAMERGSREAWSTILANLGGRAGDDEVKRLGREQVRAQRLIERNTAKLYEALREQRAGAEGEELFP